MEYRLEADETLAGGLLRVAGEAAAAAAARLDAGAGDPATAAHEARKHGKEARAALRLLRGELAAGPHREARAALREANRRLATARDSQAMVDTLVKLGDRLPERDGQLAAAALRDRRDAAVGALDEAALAAAATGFRTAAMVLAVEELARAAAGDEGSAGVGEQLRRLYRRGRRRQRDARRLVTSEAFHAWRRDAKDLWYAVRLFAPAWPGPLDALALELHRLARALGDEHDLAVLGAGLRDAGEGLLTGDLAGALGAEQQERREQALALGARIWAERPAGFAARLLAYHRAWFPLSDPSRPPRPS